MKRQIYVSKENLDYVRWAAKAHQITQRAALEEITSLACEIHRHAEQRRRERAAAAASEAMAS